tara:strand:+ start:3111 stop:3938 length:828 start_codon:yes stop_codon:yes gene_type:complete
MTEAQEQILRENIRQLIEVVKQKRTKAQEALLLEEERLRKIVRDLIDIELQTLNEDVTPDNDPVPNKSTGINVLEDLLKKIIPVLETDYKLLTTASDQRLSFRAHIINAVIDALTPAEVNNEAGEEEAAVDSLEEEVDIAIGDDDKFIDIRTDAEKADDEEEVEADPRDEFGVDGEDETGRNVAYNAFKKIQTSVIDAYELLSNSEDQELFYDYLIANLKLYFDKFESELATNVDEPTNQAYQDAKDQEADMGGTVEEPAEEPVEAGEEEIEFEL